VAKTSGLAQQFFIHGSDLSGDVGALNSVSSPRPLLEVPGINSSAQERINGLADGNMEFNVWFNDTALMAHPVLSALPTTDVIVLWALGGAVGDVAAGLVAKQVTYDPSRPSEGSVSITVQCLASSGRPLEWLDMLSAGKITHASASSSASKDDSTGTAAGITAYLQVVDIASGTPTVLIEESSDDGAGDSWATILAFTAVANGAEPTAERKVATGSVERYLRITTTGSFADLDMAVAYVRGVSQDDVDLS